MVIMLMTFYFGGLDEINLFHHGIFDAVRDNFTVLRECGSPFCLLGFGNERLTHIRHDT